MKYKLFAEIVLLNDFPEKRLKKGDIATIIDYHPVATGKDGYTLEAFNALGDTISIVTVSESDIEPLQKNEILSVRKLSAA
ncbi:MAG TPA: DUF4926 domain-containing protein [bacterium]|nr:DUF4926 domain-containing protein [bacterium]HPN45283.1 DUF4926 domain-containing protein [bacterium]